MSLRAATSIVQRKGEGTWNATDTHDIGMRIFMRFDVFFQVLKD